MANGLTLFNDNQMPAHVAGFLDEESNITERQSVNSIGISGKVFTMSLNGETNKITKKDEDGEEVPAPNLPVVILDYNKNRGRAMYEGGYDSASTKPPVCWSDDGVEPDKSVKEPQASKCATCPMAAKGSKVTEAGKATTMCGTFRMIAVAPLRMLDTPLRMKLPVTSDYDGDNAENEAKGWFAFKNYTDLLRSRGVKHTAALVTLMKFDPNKEYPKLLFSPRRWLEGEELAVVKETLKNEEVKKLLGGTYTPDGVDGKVKETAPEKPAPKHEPEVTKAAKPKPANDEDEADLAPAKPAKPAKAAEKPKPAKAAKPVDDEDEADLAPAKSKPDVAAAPAKATTSTPDDVKALLDEWD